MNTAISRNGFWGALLICNLLFIGGCSSIIASAKQDLANDLANGILNQDDPETVRSGVPAYLILISSLIDGDPDNSALLLSGAKLYASYASIFVDDPPRKVRLARKAKTYATRALCLHHEKACNIQKWSLAEIETFLSQSTVDDVPYLMALGSTWAGWIQANPSNWKAVASLPKARAFIVRVISLDEAYQQGDPHLYMGVLQTLLPPAMGGRAEAGRHSFEKAIKLSAGNNLMAKVLYAEKYARLMFDQQLHDRLLQEVLDAEVDKPGLTLINTIAQTRARELLSSSSEYF